MDVNKEVLAIAQRAKAAAGVLALTFWHGQNKALQEAAKALRANKTDILKQSKRYRTS